MHSSTSLSDTNKYTCLCHLSLCYYAIAIRIYTNYLNQFNNISDMLLHSVPVLLCRDDAIAIATISCLYTLCWTDITDLYIYFPFYKQYLLVTLQSHLKVYTNSSYMLFSTNLTQ